MTGTIVLGLDGATWDVLNPLIEKGVTPNIGAVQSEGYSGSLESVYPPTSGPAWTSMATGMNPGKTGVYYFLNRTDPEGFEFDAMSSRDFKGRSFWDLLERDGQTTGVFNFPMLQPPYAIDDYMVSGFGTNETETFTHPPELQDELREVAYNYQIKVPFSDPKYIDRPTELAAAFQDHLDDRERVMEYLLNERQTDVFCGVISVSDWLQHYYWKYVDQDHVLYNEAGEKGEELFEELWGKIDNIVGTVWDIAAERGATLILLSDHGFGPFNGTFYVNDWLEQEGFRVPAGTSTLGRIRDVLFPYARRFAEPVVQKFPVLNDAALSVGNSIKPSPVDTVNTEESIACATNKGFIHMLSDDPADRERVVDRLAAFFDDSGLDYEIFAPEELYEGPTVNCAPDILYTIEDFEYALQANSAPGSEVLVEHPPSPSRSGGHKRDGIFVVAGDGAAMGDGAQASLLDISPTILFNQGVPIPSGIDGSVIEEAFTQSYKEEREIEFRDYGIVNQNGAQKSDNEKVREHLKDLGYV